MLLDALIKNGADRVVDEAKARIYSVKTLCDFSFTEEGNERGAGSKCLNYICFTSEMGFRLFILFNWLKKSSPVREKAKNIVELLGDSEQIKEERERARLLREKIGNTVSSSGSTGGYGSSQFGGRGSVGGGGGKYGGSSSSDPRPSYSANDKKNESDEDDEDEKSKKKKKKKSKKKDVSDDEEEERIKAGSVSGSDDEKEKKKKKKKDKKDKKKVSSYYFSFSKKCFFTNIHV